MSKDIRNTKEGSNTEIPFDWHVKKINDIFYFKQGVQYAIENQFDVSNVSRLRFIRIVDLTSKNEPIRYVEDPGSEHHLKPDDIFMIRYGTPGILGYGYQGVIANNLFRIIPKKETNNKFFYYQFLFKERQIKNLASSSTMPALNFGSLSTLEILVPPLPEQTAIANLLSTWDSAIQTTNALIEQKQNRKNWLMQMLLTGKKRLKGFEKEKWKEVRLGDVFERVTKKNTERNQTVVTISAQRGFVMQNDYFNKIIASELLDNYFLVERGEFCYNKSYSNGYPMGATKRLNDFDKAVVTTLYICFKIKDYNKSSGDFFEHLFDANALDKGLMTIANEGGRAHGLLNVTTTDFFNIRINIPGFNEQEEISKILSVSNNEIQLLQNKLEQLKEQKKGLMQILLTGKKRLKVN